MTDNHEQIMYKLGEIQGTLTAVLEEAKKTNGRVRALEAFNNSLKGKIFVMSSIIAFGAAILMEWIKANYIK